MTDILSFDDQIQAALSRGEFIPLPDILRGQPLNISAYLDTLVYPERVPTDDEVASLVRALLHRYEVVDVTSNTPWRVGELRCAWQSNEADVLKGWRRLRLAGIDGKASADDIYAPVLHLTPEGGAIYAPGPLCNDASAPTLMPVECMEQLIHLLERP
jgi:hypothetical protein